MDTFKERVYSKSGTQVNIPFVSNGMIREPSVIGTRTPPYRAIQMFPISACSTRLMGISTSQRNTRWIVKGMSKTSSPMR